ncbi:unnamed protein product [Allacma fusca]|uniref:Succinate-semialdehyde dehydrogenase n=1 Tax=Allacma fusca TaxID=39272 RepID=A0A8J2KRK0_9HEXA|nr:unnamed protein product [Allacma fusca]
MASTLKMGRFVNVIKLMQITRRMSTAPAFQLHNQAFVNGNWVDAKAQNTFAVKDPATDELITSIPDMDEHDAEEAIQVASEAFKSWKRTTAKERSKILRKWYDLIIANQDSLAEIMTRESGKPLKESIGEIMYSADYVELYSEEAKRIHGEVLQSPVKSKEMLLIRQPIGVIGMLTPWNFPMAMIARKAAAALASGCTIVIKPAEDTPLSALEFAALGKEAGIPDGVVNVVTSSRKNAASVGLKLCTSPLIAGISFTGSTAVGKILYKQCSGGIKRIGLELGGNAPFIVFESADVDKAVIAATASKFRNAGQTCVACNRLFVHESIQEEFTSKLKNAISGFVVGSGLNANTNIGPLINQAQLTKVSSLVDDALSKGATAHVGGSPHSLGKLFYQPTLLSNINPTMLIYSAEIFGPVATVMSFKSEEEVIEKANDTPSGLASYFFSNDIAQIWRVAKALDYGMVGINEGIISAAEAAFGGIKESGMGREGSKHGIDEYTYIKYLCFGNLD